MDGYLRGALDSYQIQDRWNHGTIDGAERFHDRGEAEFFLRRIDLGQAGLRTLRAGLGSDSLTPAQDLSDHDVVARCAERLSSGAWQVAKQQKLTPRPSARPGLNFEVWGVDVNLNMGMKGANATFEGDNGSTDLRIDKKGPKLTIANSDEDRSLEANMDGLTLNKKDEDGERQIKLDKKGNLTLASSNDDSSRQIKVGKDGLSLSNKDGDGSRNLSINKNGIALGKSGSDGSRNVNVGKNGLALSSGDGDSRHHIGITKDGKVSGGLHLGDEDSGIGLSTDANGGIKGSATVGGITVGHSQGADGGHTTIGNDKYNVDLQEIDDFIDAEDSGAIGDVFDDIGDGDFGDAKDKISAIWDAKPFEKGANQAA